MFQKEEFEEAIKKCEKAIELDSENKVAHIYLGFALLHKEEFEEAINLAQKAGLYRFDKRI